MCYVNVLMDDGYQTPHESARASRAFDGPASENYIKHFSKKQQLLQNIVSALLTLPSLFCFAIYIKSV